jgi:hypothetical protein
MKREQIVPIRCRVTQDQRGLSRITALLPCEFTFEGATHKGVIVDLSLNGAFISSELLPPPKSVITVLLQSRHLKQPVTLHAHVVRGGWGTAEHGKLGRFGIRFDRAAPELIGLLNALISSNEGVRTKQKE